MELATRGNFNRNSDNTQSLNELFNTGTLEELIVIERYIQTAPEADSYV